MKPTFPFLLVSLSVINFFISLVHSTSTTQPLIFDPFTRKVYNLESGSPDTSPKYPYATACPALDDDEKLLNVGNSFDHKALFVRKYHGQKDNFSDEMENCETSIQLAAVLYHVENLDEIDFGYEVSEISSTKKSPINPSKQKHHLTLGKYEMRFIWITKITARYHVRVWNIIQIRYEIYRNAYQLKRDLNCADYNLAENVYKKEKLDDYYSPKNQKIIFGSVKLPEPDVGDVLDWTYDYVKKYNLLLPYNFQATSSSLVSCSDLTTVPIWYPKTEALLNYLEHFLIAIGEITQNPLKILSGVHEVVTLSTIERKPKLIPMYLDSKNKRLPIPRIIYKIIRYQSYECESDKVLCLFDAAIIIHNHPKIIQKHELCLKDKCREWGWDSIQYMNTAKTGEKSEHLYCCRFDQRLRKILDYEEDGTLAEDLNLKEFPRYEETIKDHEYTDNQKDFEEQMKQLMLQSKFF